MSQYPWKKGVSGNPTGRPKGYGEFMALCQYKAPEALARIEQLAIHPDPDVRFQANKFIIERAWGKAVTPVLPVTGDEVGFVIRAPESIPAAADWERTIDLERSEYEARAENAQAGSAGRPDPIAEATEEDRPDWAK